eukprot:TRINITY_DN1781_c0_g1_i2.p1 TRINITY_DN1781_c0_g1~~TRINITY_DN1781_c0_g1_i2.p1  ORF type:complete len:748 (+),score=221.50 TRINITY_DN1781_c0_g1_i2:388-2631(+)
MLIERLLAGQQIGEGVLEQSTQILSLFVKQVLTKEPSVVTSGSRFYDLREKIPMPNSVLWCLPGMTHAFGIGRAPNGALQLLLNSDITHQICMPDCTVAEYILGQASVALGRPVSIEEVASNAKLWKVITKDLKDKKIRLDHLSGLYGGGKAKKIGKVDASQTPTSTKFIDGTTGTQITVLDYFKRQYPKFPIKYPNAPLVGVYRQTKDGKQTNYFPIEYCRLEKAQHRDLTGDEQATVITLTCKNLTSNFAAITTAVERLQAQLPKDGPVQMTLNPQQLHATGRILSSPKLLYGKGEIVLPRGGSWQIPKNGLAVPQEALPIGFLFPNSFTVNDATASADAVFGQLIKFGVSFRKLGLQRPYTVDSVNPGSKRELESAHAQVEAYKREGGARLMLIVVMPGDQKVAKRYNAFKYQTDLIWQVHTQFLRESVVRPHEKQYFKLTGVASAINIKAAMGARVPENQTTQNPVHLVDQYTSVVGVDVNHAPAGSKRPSEAALCGTLNAHCTRFHSEHVTQKNRQEPIPDLKSLMMKFLSSHAHANRGQLLQKLIWLRDGVADTQFDTICAGELNAIRAAFAEHPAYARAPQPKIIYVVVQKRNLSRLAAIDPATREIRGPSPGTVLDNTITGFKQTDFFMVAHQALQGSPRPVHCHVIANDPKVSLLDIQTMLFQLCHLHSGCTKSVSLPAPLYYAHRLALRVGQNYRSALEDRRFDDDASSESSKTSEESEFFASIELPAFIKDTPFFL